MLLKIVMKVQEILKLIDNDSGYRYLTLQSGYAKNAPNSLNENDIAVIAAAETFIDFLSRTQVQCSVQSWVCTKCRSVLEFPSQ